MLILATASFVSPYVSSSTFIDDSERRNTIGVENSGVASVGIDGNAKYYYSIPVPLGVNSFTPELGIPIALVRRMVIWVLVGLLVV